MIFFILNAFKKSKLERGRIFFPAAEFFAGLAGNFYQGLGTLKTGIS
jgi:hypothetical protein